MQGLIRDVVNQLLQNMTQQNQIIEEKDEHLDKRVQEIKELQVQHEQNLKAVEQRADERIVQLQASFNVNKCETQLTSSIDAEHIKNMFLRYTNEEEEESIRSAALKVLFKSLAFSSDE